MPTLITQFVPLQQIFHNLISNAVKHSDCESGKTIISAVEHDGYHEFAVADRGKVINHEHHERIATIFQTLESKNSKENTGISLAIAQKTI